MTAIRDDLDNSAIIGVGISSTFVVVFLFLLLEAWCTSLDDQEMAKKTTTPASLTAYRAEQGEKLGGYGYVDQAKGQVHIPIERAKQMTLQALTAKPAAATAAAEEASE